MRICNLGIARVVLLTLVGGVLSIAQEVVPAPSPAAKSSSFDRVVASIDRLAREQMGPEALGGMTVGVVVDGHLAWTASYGFADTERHEPASRTTSYRIGSITKQFTGIMLLQLVDRGVVHLSDPASRYLPEIATAKGGSWKPSTITLYELATMTSGLAEEPDNVDTYVKGDLSHWEQTLKAALAHTKLEHEPGTTWEYSNIGYAALGAALERAAKRPYLEYVRDEILRPLGMNDTGFELTATMRQHLATGYSMENGKLDLDTPLREREGRGYKVPNGGLYSTVDDMATFMEFEMGAGPASVLGVKTRADNLMHLAWASPDLAQGYGIGIHASRRDKFIAFGHPGAVSGYLAAAYFDPATASGVVLLRNTDNKNFDVLGLCLRMLDLVSASRQSAPTP